MEVARATIWISLTDAHQRNVRVMINCKPGLICRKIMEISHYAVRKTSVVADADEAVSLVAKDPGVG